jgi:hypothetical protein
MKIYATKFTHICYDINCGTFEKEGMINYGTIQIKNKTEHSCATGTGGSAASATGQRMHLQKQSPAVSTSIDSAALDSNHNAIVKHGRMSSYIENAILN